MCAWSASEGRFITAGRRHTGWGSCSPSKGFIWTAKQNQDGPEAGQTVPHVHIHILPRKVGDFERNDIVYDLIEDKERELKKKLDLDKERMDRTAGEMAKEADELRALFWTYKSAY